MCKPDYIQVSHNTKEPLDIKVAKIGETHELEV